jgi:hypothetical protein
VPNGSPGCGIVKPELLDRSHNPSGDRLSVYGLHVDAIQTPSAGLQKLHCLTR